MDESKQLRPSTVSLSTLSTTTRPTRQAPKTSFQAVLHNGLVRTGNVAVEGLRAAAAPFVAPASSVVSAALGHANTARSFSGPGASGGQYGGQAFGTTTSAIMGAGSPNAGAASGMVGNYDNSGSMALPGQPPGLNSPIDQAGAGAGANPSDAFSQMMSATKSMTEFQASFNLQYLNLQQKIQVDTRQFNLVSNIMKAKHDAAKNSLNNLR